MGVNMEGEDPIVHRRLLSHAFPFRGLFYAKLHSERA